MTKEKACAAARQAADKNGWEFIAKRTFGTTSWGRKKIAAGWKAAETVEPRAFRVGRG